jgi:hypothetical protein
MLPTGSPETESFSDLLPEEAANKIMDAMVPVTEALAKGADHLSRLHPDLALPPTPPVQGRGPDADAQHYLSYVIAAASSQGVEQIQTVSALQDFAQALSSIDLAWLREHPGILQASLDHTWQPWEAGENLSRRDAKRCNQLVENVRYDLLGIDHPSEGHPVWLLLAANRPTLAYLDFWAEVAGYGAGQMELTIGNLLRRDQNHGEEQLAQIERILQEVLWQGGVFVASKDTIEAGLSALEDMPLGPVDIEEEINQSVRSADILSQLISALQAQDDVLPDLLAGTGQIRFLTSGAPSLVYARQMIHSVLARQAEVATMGLIGIRVSAMGLYDLSVAAIIERLNLQRMALSRIQTGQRGALQAVIAALHKDSQRLFNPPSDEPSKSG